MRTSGRRREKVSKVRARKDRHGVAVMDLGACLVI